MRGIGGFAVSEQATIDLGRIAAHEGIERRIVEKIVDDALASQYQITIDDGDDYPVCLSTDKAEVMGAMFQRDAEALMFWRGEKWIGHVFLVYGNDGHDVIAESIAGKEMNNLLAGAKALAAEIEGRDDTAPPPGEAFPTLV
jgi:hypothetical protein